MRLSSAMCVSRQQQRSSSVDISSQQKEEALCPSPNSVHEVHFADETIEESPRPRRKAAMNAAKIQIDTESEEEEEEAEKTRPRRKAKASPRPKYPHIVTQHNYHDRSRDPIATGQLVEAHSGCRGRGKGGVNVSFPVKLYEMLHLVEDEGLEHIVCFQPHGRCFIVHDHQAFKEILPNYFKLSKMSSFQRQLNLYGFSRITAGIDKGSYYHELFLRGRKDLAASIQRVKVKGTGVRAKANPEDEPDFRNYPPLDTRAEGALEEAGITTEVVTSLDDSAEFKPISSIDEQSQFRPKALMQETFSLLDPLATRSGLQHDDIWSKSLPVRTLPSIENPSKFEKQDQEMMQQATSLKSWLPDDSAASTDVSFDRLIEEMFRSDQTVDFSELLKLASV